MATYACRETAPCCLAVQRSGEHAVAINLLLLSIQYEPVPPQALGDIDTALKRVGIMKVTALQRAKLVVARFLSMPKSVERKGEERQNPLVWPRLTLPRPGQSGSDCWSTFALTMTGPTRPPQRSSSWSACCWAEATPSSRTRKCSAGKMPAGNHLPPALFISPALIGLRR